MLKHITPFIRNCDTDPFLTDVFLHFTKLPFLKVDKCMFYATVTTSSGTLHFWTANEMYAYASQGTITNKNTLTLSWNNRMPSRYANNVMRERLKNHDYDAFKEKANAFKL